MKNILCHMSGGRHDKTNKKKHHGHGYPVNGVWFFHDDEKGNMDTMLCSCCHMDLPRLLFYLCFMKYHEFSAYNMHYEVYYENTSDRV